MELTRRKRFGLMVLSGISSSLLRTSALGMRWRWHTWRGLCTQEHAWTSFRRAKCWQSRRSKSSSRSGWTRYARFDPVCRTRCWAPRRISRISSGCYTPGKSRHSVPPRKVSYPRHLSVSMWASCKVELSLQSDLDYWPSYLAETKSK